MSSGSKTTPTSLLMLLLLEDLHIIPMKGVCITRWRMTSLMPPLRSGGNTVRRRREMKANTHSKLDRLADVAARLECVEA